MQRNTGKSYRPDTHSRFDKAAKYIDYLSIRSRPQSPQSLALLQCTTSQRGGVFGALWELGQCSGVGLEIDLKKIPIRQETIEICEFFDLNPYKLLSGGSLLLAAADGNALVHAIRQAGGEAVIIGRTIDSNDRGLREVSQFVSEKLSALDSVLSTQTNFILKKYKDHGTIMAAKSKDERIQMIP